MRTTSPAGNLFQAARAFETERYEDVVIPVNLAVESALGQALTLGHTGFGSRELVEEFLSSGATYSYQLDVVSRAVAGMHEALQITGEPLG